MSAKPFPMQLQLMASFLSTFALFLGACGSTENHIAPSPAPAPPGPLPIASSDPIYCQPLGPIPPVDSLTDPGRPSNSLQSLVILLDATDSMMWKTNKASNNGQLFRLRNQVALFFLSLAHKRYASSVDAYEFGGGDLKPVYRSGSTYTPGVYNMILNLDRQLGGDLFPQTLDRLLSNGTAKSNILLITDGYVEYKDISVNKSEIPNVVRRGDDIHLFVLLLRARDNPLISNELIDMWNVIGCDDAIDVLWMQDLDSNGWKNLTQKLFGVDDSGLFFLPPSETSEYVESPSIGYTVVTAVEIEEGSLIIQSSGSSFSIVEIPNVRKSQPFALQSQIQNQTGKFVAFWAESTPIPSYLRVVESSPEKITLQWHFIFPKEFHFDSEQPWMDGIAREYAPSLTNASLGQSRWIQDNDSLISTWRWSFKPEDQKGGCFSVKSQRDNSFVFKFPVSAPKYDKDKRSILLIPIFDADANVETFTMTSAFTVAELDEIGEKQWCPKTKGKGNEKARLEIRDMRTEEHAPYYSSEEGFLWLKNVLPNLLSKDNNGCGYEEINAAIILRDKLNLACQIDQTTIHCEVRP